MTENQQKLIVALRKQLSGLGEKVLNDFSKVNYEKELGALRNDSVYPKFSFDRPEYVLIRLMGRISISVGRRLGEIYDKIPRILASARYDIELSDVAPVLDGLELDMGLKTSLLSSDNKKFVEETIRKFIGVDPKNKNGLGIEIRYNFNPNDSSRLRKDVKMAELLLAEKLVPVYLVFSSISPREEAIARLTRAGWHFLVGQKAIDFLTHILGEDFLVLLEQPEIKKEIAKQVDEIMDGLVESHAFKEVLKGRKL